MRIGWWWTGDSVEHFGWGYRRPPVDQPRPALPSRAGQLLTPMQPVMA